MIQRPKDVTATGSKSGSPIGGGQADTVEVPGCRTSAYAGTRLKCHWGRISKHRCTMPREVALELAPDLIRRSWQVRDLAVAWGAAAADPAHLRVWAQSDVGQLDGRHGE